MNSAALPDPQAWRAAAAARPELFQALDEGARIGLIARSAPAQMLVWEAAAGGPGACLATFPGYANAGVDLLMAANDSALGDIVAVARNGLFDVLRAGIRSGEVVCYMLRRRCDLEALGYEELLEALGFAFMGACR
ncbi:outer membrane efflux protein [Thauera aminoaromatica S2]|uniref:Outer membrane efflux protein n=2 Tax=Thauera aminoaromatica TaxID=164330 RepID=N6YYY4_THASP|nr:outer membrane efflux protein [Thauera aminoaromatica S2]